jgi:RNA polymerase sigma-70 factor (ECF subfamily)
VTARGNREYPSRVEFRWDHPAIAPHSVTVPHRLPSPATAAGIRSLPADVLALRARDGEAGAFAALVEVMQPRAVRFAAQMTGASRDDVDDIVQDAWIRTYRALPRYDDSRSFESWFFTILANCCRSLRVRLARWRTRSAPLDEQLRDETIDALLATSTRHDVQRVYRALATLPTAQRETFLLHYVEGFGYETIAEITGVGVSACKMRAKRAMDAVRDLLREEPDDA